MDLISYGFQGFDEMIQSEISASGESLLPGRIIELQREHYKVICEHGEISATLTGSFYHRSDAREDFPTVGDYVLIRYNPIGVSGIVRLLPRKSKFSRTDFSGHAAGYVKTVLEQVVAANFDYVFIMTSLNNDFKTSRVIRYLTSAVQSGAQPVIILTKADLVPDASHYIAMTEAEAHGAPVHAISSHTGLGMEALSEYLAPRKTIVFLGMSGVGKSSLLNALTGQTVMHVSEIRDDDSRGRHTTTHRQLFMLPSGALVIDTPGMREIGLWDADQAIGSVFADVEELFTRCRFSDCRHQSEPGCAVLAALEDGSLSLAQWERYLAQKRETRFVEDKSAFFREKNQRGKEISKFSRELKKGRKR